MTDYTDPAARDAERREAEADAEYDTHPHACGACGLMTYPEDGPHHCDLDPDTEPRMTRAQLFAWLRIGRR